MSDRDEIPDGLSSTETRQIAQIRKGSSDAFEVLFRAHEPLVYSVCLSMVGVPHVACDLTQDLFCDLWERRKTLSPRNSLKAYLAGAARNRSITWIRKRPSQTSLDDWNASGDSEHAERQVQMQSRVTPHDALQHRDLRKALRQAVQELPRRRRLIYRMARREHMTYAEISVALDISINTVKTQMGRALKYLRRRLKIYDFASHSN